MILLDRGRPFLELKLILNYFSITKLYFQTNKEQNKIYSKYLSSLYRELCYKNTLKSRTKIFLMLKNFITV
jgi:hypothetical protein